MTQSDIQSEIYDDRQARDHHYAIVKWDEYQAPNTTKWCKLYRSLIHTKTWCKADPHDRNVMIVLMMLAMEYDNRIPWDDDFIGIHGHLDAREGEDGISTAYLLDVGFIELRDGPDGQMAPAENVSKPRKKRSKKLDESQLQRFDEFWAAYPKAKAKLRAQAYWARDECDEIADQIIAAVKVQATQDDWTENGGKYIPLPSTYINEKRWEDEGTIVARQSGDLPDNAPGERGY